MDIIQIKKKYNIGYNHLSSYVRSYIDGYGYHNYGDKALDNIYCGSGGYDAADNKYYCGGGVIYFICDNIINYGCIMSNGDKYSSGGSIFMLAKTIKNYNTIQAKGKDKYGDFDDNLDGFIGIYSDKLFNSHLILSNKSIYLQVL